MTTQSKVKAPSPAVVFACTVKCKDQARAWFQLFLAILERENQTAEVTASNGEVGLVASEKNKFVAATADSGLLHNSPATGKLVATDGLPPVDLLSAFFDHCVSVEIDDANLLDAVVDILSDMERKEAAVGSVLQVVRWKDDSECPGCLSRHTLATRQLQVGDRILQGYHCNTCGAYYSEVYRKVDTRGPVKIQERAADTRERVGLWACDGGAQ